MATDYRSLFDGLRVSEERDTLAGTDGLSACEREVVLLMREARKRNRGRATFVIEFVGTAWHVLEAKPPVHVKL